MSHVGVQLVVTKVTVTAELAERMDTTFDLIFWHALLWSTLRGGQMSEVLGWRVQRVFM